MSDRNTSVRASVTQTLDKRQDTWHTSADASDQHAEAAEPTMWSSVNAYAANDMIGYPKPEAKAPLDKGASDEPVCNGDVRVQPGPSFKKAFRLFKKFDDVVHRRAGKWRKMD